MTSATLVLAPKARNGRFSRAVTLWQREDRESTWPRPGVRDVQALGVQLPVISSLDES